MVAAGDYRFGADTGRVLIRTYRTGLGSRAGHDLTIEVTAWQGTAQVGADAATSSMALRVDAESFEVREGRGGIKPLTDADRAEIRKTIRELLDITRYPAITFDSTALGGRIARPVRQRTTHDSRRDPSHHGARQHRGILW